MELKNLRTFTRVAELESFSKAAEELGYTQSAVTIQIKQLEEELHVLLFERFNKRIRITNDGQLLKHYADEMLTKEQEMFSLLKNHGVITGTLRIGTHDSLCSYFLPEVVEQFGKRCPNVKLFIRQVDVNQMYNAVNQNLVDALLCIEEPQYREEWEIDAITTVKTCFIAAPNHPLAKKRKCSLEEVLSHPLVLTEKGLSYRDELDRIAIKNGLEVSPTMEIDSTTLLMKLVATGNYVSYLPYFVTETFTGNGQLKILNCPLKSDMHCQILRHRSKLVTPQMKIFTELIEACSSWNRFYEES